jgi:hypothetical protein
MLIVRNCFRGFFQWLLFLLETADRTIKYKRGCGCEPNREVSAAFQRTEQKSRRDDLLAGHAKAPLAMLEVVDGLIQFFSPKIGPKNRRKVEFCVSDLPQQEVRYAGLAAGTDQEFGVRYAMRAKCRLKYRLVYLVGRAGACGHFLGELAGGVQDLPLGRVVECQYETDARIVFGLFDAIPQCLVRGGGQCFDMPNGHEAHPVFVEVTYLALDGLDQEAHQRSDFGGWAVPVFCAERVEGQVLHPDLGGCFGNLTHAFDPTAVAQYTWHTFLLGPPAIAIHDDRNMLWDGAILEG